jgi:hypothetical protein
VLYKRVLRPYSFFCFWIWFKKKETKSTSLYERYTLVATANEEAIGRQVGPKGEVAQKGRTYVGCEKPFNTPTLQSHPGIRP